MNMLKQEEKECPTCGKQFIPKTKDQKFCCIECEEEYDLTLDEDLAISEDLL